MLLLSTPPLDGPSNMAWDAALLARARATGEVVLRVYTWAEPTLSFGRNQRALGVYPAERLSAAGVAVVRRPTGGRAVLHAREVTYSVTAPDGALAPPGAPVRAAFARINAMLVVALGALGVSARVAAPSARAPRPDGAPCFETPTGGELVVAVGGAERKLVGSAQWQEDGALLQHGSILVDDDQSRVAGLSARQTAPVPEPATLRALLGRAPDPAEVAAALFAAAPCLAAPSDERAAPSPLDTASRAALAADAERRRAGFADPAWTWRR